MRVGEDTDRRARRRRLVSRLVFALAIILVAVALLVGFVGRSRQSEASDARETADELNNERRDLENEGDDAEQRQDEIRRLVEEIGNTLNAAVDAGNDFTTSGEAISAAENAAIDQANAGNLTEARAMFENEVGAAIAEAEAAVAAERDAIDDFEAAMNRLRELLDEQ